MTNIKISELPQSDGIRNDDVIPFSTGLRDGETPQTKKASVLEVQIGETDSNTYHTILGLSPQHYWIMSPQTRLRDEVTKTSVTSVGAQTAPLRTPISPGSTMMSRRVEGDAHFDTNRNIQGYTAISVHIGYVAFALSRFIANHSPSYNEGWQLYATNNNLIVRFGTGGGFSELASPPSGNNVFYSIVWTYNSITGHKIYRNGVEVLSSPNTTAILNRAENVFIASGPNDSATNRLQGTVHHAAIWDRVLTPTEVANISTAILGA